MKRRRPPPTSPEDRTGSGAPGVPEPRYLVIARVVRPHGVNGALRCRIVTEHPERFASLRRVYLGDPPRPFRVRRAHLEGAPTAVMVLLTLAGVDTREAAEGLRGALVQVREQDAVPLEAGEYYAHQVVGLEVVTTGGETLGRVAQVLSTGANDVYIVHGPRGEVLLPAIASVVREIDVAGGKMVVELIEGLLP